MGQPPCFDIEYWRSYRPFLSCTCLINRSGAKYKIFTVTFLILNRIIFRSDGLQTKILPFILTIHMPVFINQSLSAVLLKSTIVIFFIFHFSWTAQNSKKLELLTQYTVLCAKTLIMACAYVGFFPVTISFVTMLLLVIVIGEMN